MVAGSVLKLPKTPSAGLWSMLQYTYTTESEGIILVVIQACVLQDKRAHTKEPSPLQRRNCCSRLPGMVGSYRFRVWDLGLL